MKEHKWNSKKGREFPDGEYLMKYECTICNTYVEAIRFDEDEYEKPYEFEVKEKDCNAVLVKNIMELLNV